jgi:hypothetical protein
MNAHALSPHPTGDAPDDPPPAYSPGPDHYVGESTVEHGPYRPFRAAPPPVQHLAAHVDDAGEVAYVDARHGGSPGVWTPGGRPTLPPPPPRHPSSPGRILSPTRARPLSDFAADFFAAGTGEPPSSSGAGSDSLYAPPSGPPPERPMLGPSHHRSASQGAQSSSSSYFPTNGLPGSDTPDDGRPTRIPVPGHPLLNAGRILVYPAGHECHKCASHRLSLALKCTHTDSRFRPEHRLQERGPDPAVQPLLVSFRSPVRGCDHICARAVARATTRPVHRRNEDVPAPARALRPPACARGRRREVGSLALRLRARSVRAARDAGAHADVHVNGPRPVAAGSGHFAVRRPSSGCGRRQPG